MTTRLERITQMIEEFANDSFMDGHDAAYDAVWDEARDKGFDEGFDEGFNAALDGILLDYVHKNNLAATPQSLPDLQEMLDLHQNNGALCVMFTMNYLHWRIEEMKS